MRITGGCAQPPGGERCGEERAAGHVTLRGRSWGRRVARAGWRWKGRLAGAFAVRAPTRHSCLARFREQRGAFHLNVGISLKRGTFAQNVVDNEQAARAYWAGQPASSAPRWELLVEPGTTQIASPCLAQTAIELNQA